MRTLSKIGFVLLVMFGAISLSAQTITVNATGITDSDGTIWKNGAVQIQFVPNPSTPGLGQYTVNGVKLTDPTYNSLLNQTIPLDSSGNFSATIINNLQITPVGSQWKFIVNPLASAGGGQLTTAVTVSSNITASLNGVLKAPRFIATSGAYGYNTTEAMTQNAPGSTYYDVTLKCQNYYDSVATTWACPNGGSGSPPGGSVQSIQGNLDNVHFFGSSATVTSDGKVNGSINSQFNVQMFGAKGDCTTNDTTAFNSAQTAAITFAVGNALPSVLYLPKPPGGCYIVSNWTWKGISLEGQPTGLGPASPKTYGVTLKSLPGQDILHVTDPTITAGITKIYPGWSIRNVGFLVDNSSSGTFPHRWPGRWFDDVHMVSGSAVLDEGITHSAAITCGDVGEPIQVNGAGVAGANLVTTIASVSPCWNTPVINSHWQVVTLATPASTTVTNAHTYISVFNLPVTVNFGNAAIAQDLQDGLAADWTGTSQIGNYGKMENVSFTTTNGSSSTSPNGYPVGIYTQGFPWLYGVDVRDIFVNGFYTGIAQTCTELNSFQQSCSGDYEKWDHGLFFFNTFPWLSYNGLAQHLSDLQVTGYGGIHILSLANSAFDSASGWHISNMGFETPFGATVFGWRVGGAGHVFDGVGLTSHAVGQIGYWDAIASTCACDFTNAVINGQGNTLHSFDISALLTDNGGLGNTMDGFYNGNPLNAIPSGYKVSLMAFKGSTNLINRWTGEAGEDGNGNYNYSKDDLIIWPRDLSINNFGGAFPWATYVQTDSTSVSGAYIISTPGNTWNQFNQMVNEGDAVESIYIGSGGSKTLVPPTGMDVVLIAKCPGGTTSFKPLIQAHGGSIQSPTLSCNTTYQYYFFSITWSGSDIGKFVEIGSNSGAGSGTFYAASWQLIPWRGPINGKPVSQGGVQIVTGPTSSVLHNCVFYTDTAGTEGDSGIPCGTGLTNIQITVPSIVWGASAVCWGPASTVTPGTATMTGLTTSMAIVAGYTSNPSGVLGWGNTGGLSFQAWPTTNTVNWLVCNPSGTAFTSGSITFNVGAK